jgi:RNA recognition motif-containing protein
MKVDLEIPQEGVTNNDYKSTIFVGNLPFVVFVNDLRTHIKNCGEILNVSIIRDPKTFIGKGIAYV